VDLCGRSQWLYVGKSVTVGEEHQNGWWRLFQNLKKKLIGFELQYFEGELPYFS
jgi:hypothetical protein